MFSFRTTPLDRQEDLVLRRGGLAVLCNQSAWDPERQEYLFESLYRNGRLRKVLFPAVLQGNCPWMPGCWRMWMPLSSSTRIPAPGTIP